MQTWFEITIAFMFVFRFDCFLSCFYFMYKSVVMPFLLYDGFEKFVRVTLLKWVSLCTII